ARNAGRSGRTRTVLDGGHSGCQPRLLAKRRRELRWGWHARRPPAGAVRPAGTASGVVLRPVPEQGLRSARPDPGRVAADQVRRSTGESTLADAVAIRSPRLFGRGGRLADR